MSALLRIYQYLPLSQIERNKENKKLKKLANLSCYQKEISTRGRRDFRVLSYNGSKESHLSILLHRYTPKS